MQKKNPHPAPKVSAEQEPGIRDKTREIYGAETTPSMVLKEFLKEPR